MTDSWLNTYARIAPFAIVAAAVLGYLLAGGIWWGIPVIVVAALAYAIFRVGLARRINGWLSRRIRQR